MYGTLADPSPAEKKFNAFDKEVGCLWHKRTTKIELGRFVGGDPPPQLQSSQGWNFQKEHGKPGFIGYGNASTPAVASFDVSCFGQKSVLELEYLLSYDGMGVVQVVVDSNDPKQQSNTTVVIDGLWNSLASVPWFQTIAIPKDLETVRVTFQILSSESEPANESLSSNEGIVGPSGRGPRKFELYSIQCC